MKGHWRSKCMDCTKQENENIVQKENGSQNPNGNQTTQDLTTKRWILYVIITFVLTYTFEFGVVYPFYYGVDYGTNNQMRVQILMAACMFIPAIGALLTRLITKEGFQNAMLMPRFKGNIKIYLLAYFGPAVLTVLGSVLYFLIFPSQFDANCGYLVQIYEASGVDMSTFPMPMAVVMLVQFMQAALLGPILNFITCFGEEWGWRGYMVPKMAEKIKPIPMLLLSGVIWGLWHAPLTAIGHNYGVGYAGYPFTGILAMCGFCIMMGIFLAFVTLKTGSCIPAVLGHGALNSIAGIGIYFTTNGGNPFVGPAPTGIIGAAAFIVADILILVFWFCKNYKTH